MPELASLYGDLVGAWRALPLGPVERNFIRAAGIGLCFLVVICAIERAYGFTTQYRSRAFSHDVAYWFYFRLGLNRLLLVAPFIALLEQPLSFLDVKLLTPLPFALQVVVYLVVADFFAYWIHRAEHEVRFLWAFHTTHHSQENLNFATNLRFHPIDHFYRECLAYVPLRILGVDPMVWLPLYLLDQVQGALQHTRIPWKYGPLYKVLVSPRFHAYHHSIDQAHHNRHFGSMFSFWDYLFGTAVPDNAQPPERFGLPDVKPTSLWSTLATPFLLLARPNRDARRLTE